MAIPAMRILVILHLFYPEEWVKIKKYLKTLKPHGFDLKVTVTVGHVDEDVLADVRAFCPGCEIFTLPNIGYDVGPFIHVLNQVDLSKYDLVYKLQSKGIKAPLRYIYDQVFIYKDWFLNLYRGIFGRWRTHGVIRLFEKNPKLGLVAAKNLIVEDPVYKKEFTRRIATKYGINLKDSYRYVAGTCFVVRAKCLQPIKDLKLTLADFEQTKRGEFSTAHAFERIVCAVIENEGYHFKGLWTLRNSHIFYRQAFKFLSPLRLFRDTRFELDYEFFYKVIESRKLYSYSVREIRLGDIKRRWDDGTVSALDEVVPFKYLSGGDAGKVQYEAYCRDNADRTGFAMSVGKYDALIGIMERDGFDSRKMPVLTRGNLLMDGQHRCCWLLHKYGPDHKISVLHLCFVPIKPVQKIKGLLRRFFRSDVGLLRRSEYFDEKWYRENYPDVKAHTDAIAHYLKIGWKKGYNPGPKFNGDDYLRLNPDVRMAGVNPLVHYLSRGMKEGRATKASSWDVDLSSVRLNPLHPRTSDVFFSVIVTSYNYEKYISETLDGLVRQAYKNFEVIVVDDGSRDNSVQVIAEYAKKYDFIKLYQHPDGLNHGIAISVAMGIEKAKGDYIAFCESDDYWTADHLEKVNRFIKKTGGLIIVNDLETFGDAKRISQLSNVIRHRMESIRKSDGVISPLDFREANYIVTFSATCVEAKLIKSCDLITCSRQSTFDWWIWRQICFNNRICLLDEKLTFFRIHKSFTVKNSEQENHDHIYVESFKKSLDKVLESRYFL